MLIALLIACSGDVAPSVETPAPPTKIVYASDPDVRARQLLAEVPLIDGHNDLPWQYRKKANNQMAGLDLRAGTTDLEMHTDLARLETGMIGGQFWSVYVPVSYLGADAVQATMEQIDVVHRLVEHHPDTFGLALTADEVEAVFESGRIASLIGMEGGHSIGNSLGALRQMYALGARYMTLTHSTNTDWADSATDDAAHGGLTDFGREVVREMNRLGMLVDLSHVSPDTMRDVLEIAGAPVIFSHSSAWGVVEHPRNVSDEILTLVKTNGGVVMVNFLPAYVSAEVRDHWVPYKALREQLNAKHPDDEDAVRAELDAWIEANPAPRATLAQVADHIDHIRDVAGVDHIGLGADFDGMRSAPEGLDDVAGYPALFAELLRRGYSDDDVRKIAGLNVLRALRGAEATAALQRDRRSSDVIFIEAGAED